MTPLNDELRGASDASGIGSHEAAVRVAGQRLVMLPEKAGWLPEHRTLLVADVHFGKAVSFRSLGVPVPRGTTTETLNLLSTLLRRLDARHIVFLGDFLHSVRSHAPATLNAIAHWRAVHAGVALTLVRGNHDDRAGDPPASLGIHVVDEPFMLGELALCHHPRPRLGSYVLAGHLHPCVSVPDRSFGRLRLPCFHLRRNVGVLPAFGSFTGMHPVVRADGDMIFAVTDERVVRLPS